MGMMGEGGLGDGWLVVTGTMGSICPFEGELKV